MSQGADRSVKSYREEAAAMWPSGPASKAKPKDYPITGKKNDKGSSWLNPISRIWDAPAPKASESQTAIQSKPANPKQSKESIPPKEPPVKANSVADATAAAVKAAVKCTNYLDPRWAVSIPENKCFRNAVQLCPKGDKSCKSDVRQAALDATAKTKAAPKRLWKEERIVKIRKKLPDQVNSHLQTCLDENEELHWTNWGFSNYSECVQEAENKCRVPNPTTREVGVTGKCITNVRKVTRIEQGLRDE